MAENESDNPGKAVGGWGPFQTIRMGPGVVGRTTGLMLGVAAVAFAAVVALRDDPWLAGGVFLLFLAAVSVYIWRAFRYAERHPEFATLDGALLIKYKEIEQAARDRRIIDVTPNPVANTTPAEITSRVGNDV